MFTACRICRISDSLANWNYPSNSQYLFLSCCQLDATNARDQLFALLGIASDASDPVLDPDYHASVQDAFTRSTRHLITRDGSLQILHAAGTGFPRYLADLPSWVPDWSAAPTVTFLGVAANSAGYRTAGSSTAQVSANGGSRCIELKGSLPDTVAHICPPVS